MAEHTNSDSLIDVYDISGKRVMEHVDEKVLTHLPKGLYILKLNTPRAVSIGTARGVLVMFDRLSGKFQYCAFSG